MSEVDVRHGDCREVLATLEPDSVDACVTDPPYGLSFMGKDWDKGVPGVEFWLAVYRALKPGAHLLAFSGTRTQHRMVCAIEDAGFEIRDQIGWAYGSGFPKSHDVSKGIDRAAGAEREIIGEWKPTGTARIKGGHGRLGGGYENVEILESLPITAPATDAARQWSGWGTALKPAWEPICVARKPLIGTVAANVLAHGTGALNIDGCRVGADDKTPAPVGRFVGSKIGPTGLRGERNGNADSLGRWPANLLHDGSDEVLDLMGDAARFFYTPKADKGDRLGSKHPTVKPVDLMAYLCRLVTPPGGTVLDPFAGSGTTGMAAMREGFNAVLIELEAESVADIRRRLAHVHGEDTPLFAGPSLL